MEDKIQTENILIDFFITGFVSSEKLTDLAYICPRDMNNLLVTLYDYENKEINDDIKLKISRYLYKSLNAKILSSNTTENGWEFVKLLNQFPELRELARDILQQHLIPLNGIRYLNDDAINDCDDDNVYNDITYPLMGTVANLCLEKYQNKDFDFIKNVFNYLKNTMRQFRWDWEANVAYILIVNLKKTKDKKQILKLVSPHTKQILDNTFNITFFHRIKQFFKIIYNCIYEIIKPFTFLCILKFIFIIAFALGILFSEKITKTPIANKNCSQEKK